MDVVAISGRLGVLPKYFPSGSGGFSVICLVVEACDLTEKMSAYRDRNLSTMESCSHSCTGSQARPDSIPTGWDLL